MESKCEEVRTLHCAHTLTEETQLIVVSPGGGPSTQCLLSSSFQQDLVVFIQTF